MPPNTTPAAEAGTTEPHSAADHCAAAEALFARARTMYPTLGSTGAEHGEYKRCFDWADMHLRIAEAMTAGAHVVADHHPLLAQADVRVAEACLSHETYRWTEFLHNGPGKRGRTA